MRAFIALELPEEIKKEIAEIQTQLKKTGIKATWVKPEIVHLTLAFLGSIAPNQGETIYKVLKENCPEKPIQLELEQAGCFPHPIRPRVIFVELEGEINKLNNLAKQIRQGLKKEKIWLDDKPFVAHVTIGRAKRRLNLTHVLKKIRVKKVKFSAQEITLNKSKLTPSGPVYSKLKRITLA